MQSAESSPSCSVLGAHLHCQESCLLHPAALFAFSKPSLLHRLLKQPHQPAQATTRLHESVLLSGNMPVAQLAHLHHDCSSIHAHDTRRCLPTCPIGILQTTPHTPTCQAENFWLRPVKSSSQHPSSDQAQSVRLGDQHSQHCTVHPGPTATAATPDGHGRCTCWQTAKAECTHAWPPPGRCCSADARCCCSTSCT